MKKVIVLLLTVILGCFVVDRIGSKICDVIHKNSDGITASKYRHLFNNCDEDMILLGTSRCEAHYVSSIISDSLGIKVYNGGIDASDNIFSHYSTLCLTLKHHTPRFIGLELSHTDFAEMPDPFNTMSYLAPYIGQDEEVDNIFRIAGSYWKYQISHLYRYNAKIMADFAGYVIPYGENFQNGYLKKDKPTMAPYKKDTMPSAYPVDTLKVQYLNKFVSKCKDKNIQLFCMISPSYDKAEATTYSFLHDWAKENGILLLDFHTSGLFSDEPEMFYDNRHLCDDGAVRYTRIFVHALKENSQKKFK